MLKKWVKKKKKRKNPEAPVFIKHINQNPHHNWKTTPYNRFISIYHHFHNLEHQVENPSMQKYRLLAPQIRHSAQIGKGGDSNAAKTQTEILKMGQNLGNYI